MKKLLSRVLLMIFGFAACSCGGGSISSTPTSAAFTPVNVQGQYQVVGHSSVSPDMVLLVEANFTESGTSGFAGAPSVIFIQGTQTSSGITLNDLGGECDASIVGKDSIEGRFSSSTDFSVTLTEAGSLGTGTASGTVTFSSDGTQIVSGTYSIPSECGFVAALSQYFRKLPATLKRSLTWDRGLEMVKQKDFPVATDVQVYFCDPQSLWQCGTNEKHQPYVAATLPARNRPVFRSQAQRPGRAALARKT